MLSAILESIRSEEEAYIGGYPDTADALSSYQSREKKPAIVKDPHTGAFAIITMARKPFGGARGGPTGFPLQLCELALLLGVWIGGLV